MKNQKLNQLLKVTLWFYLNFYLLKEIIIKIKDNTTKFKIRCPKYLYTAFVEDPKKAEKIKSAIPKDVVKVELGEKKKKKEEKKPTGKKAPKS